MIHEQPAPESPFDRDTTPLEWILTDTIVLILLLIAAVLTRFWRLGHPNDAVFDEIHFVGEGLAYLRGEAFIDPHPPLVVELIALCIKLFGDHPWSWRVATATIGTSLVGITYFLGRRLLGSRMAATLAALFILTDGAFLVDSRTAVLDIAYVSFAALAGLMLFRFAQSRELSIRRHTLVYIGLTLGLCLGSKAYVPIVAVVLVTGFLIYGLARPRIRRLQSHSATPLLIFGAVLLVGSACAIALLAVFVPNFALGRWGGLQGLWQYYLDARWEEQTGAETYLPDNRSSPWWTWPFMLHPFTYWHHASVSGDTATIWFGGNPVLWWAALGAILITGLSLFRDRALAKVFLMSGYLGFLLIWVPIGRPLFLYHYMPSLYFSYLALAAVLTECWQGKSRPWEQATLLLTLSPAILLGLGTAVGVSCLLTLIGAYVVIVWQNARADKLICGSILAAALIAFVYFFPVWVGLPIRSSAYKARMWMQAPRLCEKCNWM